MKKLVAVLVALVLALPFPARADFVSFVGTSGSPPVADCSGTPAYYWIDDGDGTGTWDNSNTANWSTSSGGSGGAGPPTAADDVCFDSNSGSGTATISGTSASRNVEVANWTGTLSHPSSTTWTISGGLQFDTEFTYSKGGTTNSAITLNAASGSWTIKTLANSMGSVTINGTNPTFTLASQFISAGALSVSDGNFDSNDYAVTLATFVSSTTNTRSIDFGASTVTLTSNNFNFGVGTNLTFTAGTSTISMSHANPTFAGAGKTFYSAVFTSTGTVDLTGANTFTNLTRTVASGSAAELLLSADQTITGTLTITGNSATERIYVGSNLRGTSRTLTAATVSVNAADFEDITGAGAGSWNLSGASNYVGLCGGNSGITGTTPATLYWVGNGGNLSDSAHWSTSSGGAGGARSPLCSDTATIDANSFSIGSQTLTIDRARLPGLNGSAVTNSPTLASASATTIYGDFNWGATGTVSGGGDWILAGRSTYSINFDATFASTQDLTIDAPGGTYTLNDTLTGASNSSMTLSQGSLDLNDRNVTMGTATISGSGTRSLSMGSGTFTLTSGSWQATTITNLTFNAETSTINVAGTGTQAFNGGGLTYYNLTWASSTGTKTINSNNTFNNLTLTAPLSAFRFNANSTQTVTGTVNCTGSSGNTITWTSTSTTNATLSKASGSVTCDYITINDITGTGGATFSATNATCSDATNWSCS